MMPQDCSHIPEWVYASSCSQSPASSSESYNLSPGYAHLPVPKENFDNCLQAQVYNIDTHQVQESVQSTRRARCRMVGIQRQSASEREKMRMRSLSKALHNLRSYLPPSVVPPGRNLTKIETLRLTIRYISYLSQLLGLTEETLRQRRQPKPEMNHNTYSTIVEGCQEVTCRHYQQTQQYAQSPLVYDQTHQCSSERIPPMQLTNIPIELEPWMPSSVCHRRHKAVADFSLSSPYCTRFTHLYQVADYRSPDLQAVASSSLIEDENSFRIPETLHPSMEYRLTDLN
ncbi:uncharacterized protein WCC33_006448 [Rhinophrynus dorsalis]